MDLNTFRMILDIIKAECIAKDQKALYSHKKVRTGRIYMYLMYIQKLKYILERQTELDTFTLYHFFTPAAFNNYLNCTRIFEMLIVKLLIAAVVIAFTLMHFHLKTICLLDPPIVWAIQVYRYLTLHYFLVINYQCKEKH